MLSSNSDDPPLLLSPTGQTLTWLRSVDAREGERKWAVYAASTPEKEQRGSAEGPGPVGTPPGRGGGSLEGVGGKAIAKASNSPQHQMLTQGLPPLPPAAPCAIDDPDAGGTADEVGGTRPSMLPSSQRTTAVAVRRYVCPSIDHERGDVPGASEDDARGHSRVSPPPPPPSSSYSQQHQQETSAASVCTMRGLLPGSATEVASQAGMGQAPQLYARINGVMVPVTVTLPAGQHAAVVTQEQQQQQPHPGGDFSKEAPGASPNNTHYLRNPAAASTPSNYALAGQQQHQMIFDPMTPSSSNSNNAAWALLQQQQQLLMTLQQQQAATVAALAAVASGKQPPLLAAPSQHQQQPLSLLGGGFYGATSTGLATPQPHSHQHSSTHHHQHHIHSAREDDEQMQWAHHLFHKQQAHAPLILMPPFQGSSNNSNSSSRMPTAMGLGFEDVRRQQQQQFLPDLDAMHSASTNSVTPSPPAQGNDTNNNGPASAAACTMLSPNGSGRPASAVSASSEASRQEALLLQLRNASISLPPPPSSTSASSGLAAPHMLPTPSHLSASSAPPSSSSSLDRFHRPGRLTHLERPALGFFDFLPNHHHHQLNHNQHHLISAQTHSETGLVVEDPEDEGTQGEEGPLTTAASNSSLLAPTPSSSPAQLSTPSPGGLQSSFSPSYKKKPCRSYLTTGSCKHGEKCLFSHATSS